MFNPIDAEIVEINIEETDTISYEIRQDNINNDDIKL